MGMDWDPEADAAASRENRGRLWLTIVIVLMIFAFAGKKLYERHQRQQAEEQHQYLQDLHLGQ